MTTMMTMEAAPSTPDRTIQCSTCGNQVRRSAAFCSRCGRSVEKPVVNLANVRTPIPLAGWIFLAAALLGPAALGLGLFAGSTILLVLGIVLTVVVVAFFLLGLLG